MYSKMDYDIPLQTDDIPFDIDDIPCQMDYDIPCHKLEVPQQTKLGETAQIYTFVPLTQDRNTPPRYLNGLDLWKPPDANFDGQQLPYIPADVVRLMLPFGPELMR